MHEDLEAYFQRKTFLDAMSRKAIRHRCDGLRHIMTEDQARQKVDL